MNKLLRIFSLLLVLSICNRAYAAITVDWQVATGNAEWGARVSMGAVSNTAGTMFMLLGHKTSTENDVWASTTGVTWSALTLNAIAEPPGGRYNLATAYFNNNLWILGGQTFAGTPLRQIYTSNRGATWAAEPTPEWTGKRLHSAAVYDSKLWVLGGEGIYGASNDVWSRSTSSAVWTNSTMGAGWEDRHSSATIVYDGKLWVIGGSNGSTYYFDAWHTTDGATWTATTLLAEWSFVAPVEAIERYLIPYVLNDTLFLYVAYTSKLWSTTDGVTWTEVSQTGSVPPSMSRTTGLTVNGVMVLLGGFHTDSPTGDLAYVWTGRIVAYPTGSPTESATATPWPPSRTYTPTSTVTTTPTFTRTIEYTATVTPTNTPYATFTSTWTNSPTSVDTATITETPTVTETSTITATITPTRTMTPYPTPFLYYLKTDTTANGPTVWIAWQKYDEFASYKIEYGESLENVVWVDNNYNTSGTVDKMYYPLCCFEYNKDYEVRVTVQTHAGGTLMVSNTITVNLGTEGLYKFSLDYFQLTPVVNYDGKLGVITKTIDHWYAEECNLPEWEYIATIPANGVRYVGVANTGTGEWHWRCGLTAANGIAEAVPYVGAEFEGAGTTMTAFFFGDCTAPEGVPTLYYNANTVTVGTQGGFTIATGGTDAGVPSSGKVGGGTETQLDWFATMSNTMSYIKITVGNSETKVWLCCDAYRLVP